MSLRWQLARMPVSLLAAGVGRMDSVLPTPGDESSGPVSMWAPASLGLAMLGRAARAGEDRFGDTSGRWRELRNKVRAFSCFRSAGATGEGSTDDVYADLWRREGSGYLHGRYSNFGPAARQESPPGRPDRIPHHTGMGLGMAARHLESLRPRSSTAEICPTVDGFMDECRRRSMPGHVDATIEALGLTVKLLHSPLLNAVEQVLRVREPTARALFWHGVGRGLYLDPADLAPREGDRWRSLELALAASSDETGRSNAISGLAWATTLVNIRHPEIIARRLSHAKLQEHGESVANGVASVTLLWRDAVGDDAVLRGLLAHRPAPETAAAELWQRLVVEPSERALRDTYPRLRDAGTLGALFRYRPLERRRP